MDKTQTVKYRLINIVRNIFKPINQRTATHYKPQSIYTNQVKGPLNEQISLDEPRSAIAAPHTRAEDSQSGAVLEDRSRPYGFMTPDPQWTRRFPPVCDN